MLMYHIFFLILLTNYKFFPDCLYKIYISFSTPPPLLYTTPCVDRKPIFQPFSYVNE